MLYFVFTYLHVIGASVLLGTGAGIAFFMLMAHLSGDPRVVAGVARIVVIADFLFTATAVIAAADHRLALIHSVGYGFAEDWIVLSIVLDLITGTFWLPVVWMQVRMRDLAQAAVGAATPLPDRYQRLFCWWFAFGFPCAVGRIFWLMIARPPEILVGAGTPPGSVRWPER